MCSGRTARRAPRVSARRPLAAACEAVYRATLARTAAARLVTEALAREPLPPGPVRLAALGKAAAPMLEAALAALRGRAREPLCVLPEGARPPVAPGARCIAAGHPRPTAGSLEAGQALLDWAAAGGGAPALVLLSGGGSALAVAPAEGLAPEEKAGAIAALMRAGLTIQALNAVRKHLSRLKGGQLGARLAPADVRVLVLSDVPGDDLSVIASGPLAPDPSTFGEALAAVHDAGAALPGPVRARLEAGARGELPETPKPGDPRLAGVRHRLLAGPVDLARTAAEVARGMGMEAAVDPVPLTGDVVAVAARLALWARERAGRPGARGPRLLALGGEPTIRIPAAAAAPEGGRAQHLALLAAAGLDGLPAALLAAGSDGRDGPTGQAGAVVDGESAGEAARRGIDLARALAEARSGPAAVALGAAIPRFETGTHLCDLVLVAVE
ncbi:glycerate 2-kinase [Anaeromyxobacter dehalogenans 2CP-C]|uniref:Glycerate 2-kinase n=1 Tax=Anaeromyxobacter dehalogenans (strain 2CP-C) TaxID=290397 RepID=Q2IGM5_ANADE|nr:glycerate 2-kinase [Anaeromyxobacter dehalogenans 2CP-C]